MSLAATHFNAITPENCMKPERVHPEESVWRFERADALVQWAGDHDMAIHGHTLVWHAQTNDWFFRDGDKATVTQRMKDHIHTLVGRYKGRIQSWDVVNEAINDGGNARTAQTENLRNSHWLQAMGPEFLTLAFRFAHEADPDAKLYYDDYGIEAGPKHASSMVLARASAITKVCSTSSRMSTEPVSRSSAPSRSRDRGSGISCPDGMTGPSSSTTAAKSTSSPVTAAPIRSKNSRRTSSAYR
jgi:hypothetical protein